MLTATRGARRRGLSIAAAVLAMGLAACGSSDDAAPPDDSNATTAGPSAGPSSGWSDGGFKVNAADLKCGSKAADPTRGVTPDSITIGGLAYLTSPNGSSMAGTDAGAKARFERANAEGGVHGRKINFIGVLDDGQDVARNTQQASRLVEQDKVFAVVPLMTSNTGYLDTFCGNVVPFFGWGFNQGYCSTAIGFGITGCQFAPGNIANNSLAYSVNSMFEGEPASRTVAFVGVDNDSARAGVKTLAAYAKAGGLDVVYAENPTPAAGLTDPTPVVQAIMRSNKGAPPDVVYHVTDFQSTLKLTTALKAAGYPGKQLSPTYDPRLAGLKDLDGAYGNVQWLPAIDDSNPVIKQLLADLAAYAPDQAPTLSTMAGYYAADMFLTAAEKVGPDLTVDKLLSVLNNNYTYELPGALPETRWPLNHVISAPCSSVAQIKDGAWHVVGPLSCGSVIVAKK
ncbi:ABC transporter substrate-binding protein [Frankia sp. CNm7]|uniref:ABC transporter substrate-binding protein n=1 Tax=Frankia nepalensis TaxID=1836974 RepID=A0A937RCN2_9ACTN|nr:ABC transporter substrate-binding protein [Frankia nepalensis]MBL7496678.1 ABC transporter substrate-binding protein [Frankia nepalensis]MBL7510680.1 ABC transporter substrate-binding protein [Frankia nepalensis]MBL7516687.1 ABC transporter substrate-binding protein [Frankia nepalensis]MBL7627417.1 ABC transporter substrate-binding protein [Frankia nepalensis]